MDAVLVASGVSKAFALVALAGLMVADLVALAGLTDVSKYYYPVEPIYLADQDAYLGAYSVVASYHCCRVLEYYHHGRCKHCWDAMKDAMKHYLFCLVKMYCVHHVYS